MTTERAQQMYREINEALDGEVIEMFHVIYPEDCYVTADVILGWAHDVAVNLAVDDHVKANGVISDDEVGDRIYKAIVAANPRPTDLREAMDLLMDQGTHTFGLNHTSGVMVNRMQDVLRPLGRQCFPKEQHATRGAAEAQMRSITKRGLEKDVSRIHVYKCPHCLHPETSKPAWHVGHGRI